MFVMMGNEYLGEVAGFVQNVDRFECFFDWGRDIGAM